MDKLNKFLEIGEVLVAQTGAKPQAYKVYFLYLLIFSAFFVLYPMLGFGRVGFFIWLAVVFLLFILLARQIVSSADQYLLTNQRLICVQAVSKDYFKKSWHIYLGDIRRYQRRGQHQLIIRTDYKNYHLQLQKIEAFYRSLAHLLEAILVKH